jgi:hypothetical protein
MRPRSLLLALACLSQAASAPAGTWLFAGKGDCPGAQVRGSPGPEPDAEQCTPAFAGRTALCFTQVCNPGCMYIDERTPDCAGGSENADLYTCVAETPKP